MVEVEVIGDPATATVALDPVRSRLLSELAEPASAATLATRLGIARQKINYHLRALETHRLVRVAGKRQWGGLTERVLVATAASYVVSPSALGPVATDPDRSTDRFPQAISLPWLRASCERSAICYGVQGQLANACQPYHWTRRFDSGPLLTAPRSVKNSPKLSLN